MLFNKAHNIVGRNTKQEILELDIGDSETILDHTKEQEKIMIQSKLVLLPETKIIHIKVMVNEQVDLETVKSIQNILPENQQAMIISFENISDETASSISNDHAIQIIDKKTHINCENVSAYEKNITKTIWG